MRKFQPVLIFLFILSIFFISNNAAKAVVQCYTVDGVLCWHGNPCDEVVNGDKAGRSCSGAPACSTLTDIKESDGVCIQSVGDGVAADGLGQPGMCFGLPGMEQAIILACQGLIRAFNFGQPRQSPVPFIQYLMGRSADRPSQARVPGLARGGAANPPSSMADAARKCAQMLKKLGQLRLPGPQIIPLSSQTGSGGGRRPVIEGRPNEGFVK